MARETESWSVTLTQQLFILHESFQKFWLSHSTTLTRERVSEILHQIFTQKINLMHQLSSTKTIIYSLSDRCLVSKLFDVCPRSTIAEMDRQEEVRVTWGTGIAGFVAESGEPVNIPDAYEVNGENSHQKIYSNESLKASTRAAFGDKNDFLPWCYLIAAVTWEHDENFSFMREKRELFFTQSELENDSFEVRHEVLSTVLSWETIFLPHYHKRVRLCSLLSSTLTLKFVPLKIENSICIFHDYLSRFRLSWIAFSYLSGQVSSSPPYCLPLMISSVQRRPFVVLNIQIELIMNWK